MDDVDLDFEEHDDDPIRNFLIFKLEELKFNNKSLEDQLIHRKELQEVCKEKIAKQCDNVLNINNVWHKTVKSKWITGIEIFNPGSGQVNDVNVIMNWDSLTPMTYISRMFIPYKSPKKVMNDNVPIHIQNIAEKIIDSSGQNQEEPLAEGEWISSACITSGSNSTIILCINNIKFTTQIKYQLNGTIKYKYNGRSFQLNIPNFEITANIFLEDRLTLKSHDLLRGIPETFLTLLTATELITDFVITIPELNLEDLLQIKCCFKKLPIVSRNKFYFLVDQISEAVNGGLVEICKNSESNTYFMKVFNTNVVQTQLLLHYLYQKIDGLIVLPKMFQCNLIAEFENSTSFTETFNPAVPVNKTVLFTKFAKSLEEQIALIEKVGNCKMKEADSITFKSKDYKTFREKLAEVELTSDALFSKIRMLTNYQNEK